jgi:hypothetical protein
MVIVTGGFLGPPLPPFGGLPPLLPYPLFPPCLAMFAKSAVTRDEKLMACLLHSSGVTLRMSHSYNAAAISLCCLFTVRMNTSSCDGGFVGAGGAGRGAV